MKLEETICSPFKQSIHGRIDKATYSEQFVDERYYKEVSLLKSHIILF